MNPLIPTGAVAVATVCCLAGATASVQAGEAARKRFDIARGDAAGTLKRFAEESGQQVVYLVDAVRGITTNPVRGDYTVREALRRLVADTGLVVVEDVKSGALLVNRLVPEAPPPKPNPPTTMLVPMKKSLPARLTAFFAALAASSLAAQTTPAESETIKLSPFEVSTSQDRGYRASNSIGGTRVNTPLKEVPMNIQVVTEEFMRDIAAFDASESLKFQAGVEVGSRDGDRDTAVTIRGFGTTWQMREGFRRYDTSDSINIARQEVVAGPAAVLYGISQPGGIINYITKRPTRGTGVELRQVVGSDGLFRSEVDVNYAPAGPLALRLLGAHTKADGFRDYERVKRTFVAPIAVYRLDAATTFTVDIEYMKQDRGFTHNKLRDVSLTATGGTVNLPSFLSVPREQQWTGPDTVHTNDVTNLLFVADHKFSENFSVNAAFNSLERTQQRTTQTHRGLALAALRDRNGALVLDANGAPIKALRTLWASDNNQNWMWQARVDGVLKFDVAQVPQTLLTGFNFAKDTNYRILFEDRNPDLRNGVDNLAQNFRYYTVGTRRPNLRIGNADYNPVNWARPQLHYRDPIELTSYYANHQAKLLGDSLFTLAGIRFDKNDYSRKWQTRRTGQNDVVNSVTDKWSPNYGLLYRPIPWVSVYALSSESLEPRNGSTNSFGVNLTPSFGKSIEAGLKLEAFDGRVSATFSAYRIKNKNLPVTDPTIPNANGGLGDVIQVGEQTSEGYDFTAFFFPVKDWQITGGWSYVDTFISSDTNRANLGRNFSNLPYNRFTLFTSYRLPGGWTIGGGALHTGEIDRGWNDPITNLPVQNDRYTTFDAFARYEFKLSANHRCALSLNVLNFSDQQDRGGGEWIVGRTYRLTAGVRF
ncbi:MAG: TonB-dependent receptor [Opitutaceae bacterium]|nr:TonB-dependent receptor [Opitutaceae bacterium]